MKIQPATNRVAALEAIDRFTQHARQMAIEHYERNADKTADINLLSQALQVGIGQAVNAYGRWDPDNAMAFAGEILTDANLHDERVAMETLAWKVQH